MSTVCVFLTCGNPLSHGRPRGSGGDPRLAAKQIHAAKLTLKLSVSPVLSHTSLLTHACAYDQNAVVPVQQLRQTFQSWDTTALRPAGILQLFGYFSKSYGSFSRTYGEHNQTTTEIKDETSEIRCVMLHRCSLTKHT